MLVVEISRKPAGESASEAGPAKSTGSVVVAQEAPVPHGWFGSV